MKRKPKGTDVEQATTQSEETTAIDFRGLGRLRKAASDETEARNLVASLLPRVRRRILLLTRPDQDTDDLVAQCLVEIIESLPRFRGQSSLETWADKVTYRVAMRSLKRRRRRERTELAETTSQDTTPFSVTPALSGGDPHNQAVSNALLEGIRHHLASIPEPRRTAVVLKIFLGHSVKEVASTTGVPLETARSRIKKGLTELRESLGQDTRFLDLVGRQKNRESTT